MVQLSIILNEEPEDHILAATAWALGQIGRHSPEHAKAIALANALPRLLKLYLDPSSSEDLQSKVNLIVIVEKQYHAHLGFLMGDFVIENNLIIISL